MIKIKQTIFQKFGLFFYDHVKTTASVWIALVIFGVLSYSVFMQRQGFPNVAVPISITSGTYFVDDKSKVDQDIVKPYSEIASKQPGVKTVTSNAGANFYSVVVEYKDGTDVKVSQDKLKSLVKQAGFMPISATQEYQDINASKINNQYDVLLSVTNSTDTALNDLVLSAKAATKLIEGTAGVEKVTVLDPFKTGVNPSTGQSVNIQQSFDRIARRENGKTVFYPSVELGIVAKAGTDAIHLERSINDRLSWLNKSKDIGGAKVAISTGVAENIETQVSGLQQNLLEGLVVVIVISLLLISFRAGLATALSMATVLLLTIGILYVVGITLNTITLFALVLCLGLIVDDTTIMAEAIDAGKNANLTNREIVAKAIKRVARASTAGTLVTMMAFAPMLFIGGVLGSFIRVLPITIIVSLAVSLLVSIALIPFLSHWLLLSQKSKKAQSHNPILATESWMSDKLASLIRVGTHSRKKAATIGLIAIAISFVFLAGSTVFFKKLKFDIFPATKDSDGLLVTISFPSGTTIDSAQKIADNANEILAKTLGDSLRDVSYMDTGSEQGASAMIRLTSFKKRDITSPQLIKVATDAFAGFEGAIIKVGQSDAGPPKDDLPFKVQVYGEDVAKTGKLAADMAAYLQDRNVVRASNKTTAKIVRTKLSGNDDFVKRVGAKRLIEVQAGFNSDDVSALVTAAQKEVEKEFTPAKIASYGISKADVKFDFGSESANQDSFKAMLFAFPVLFLLMYVLLAFQFKSLFQPLLIFMAIPFSFFGVAAGLNYTNNPLSFFVMVGFFALIGIAVNNTILLTDFANQARREGKGGFEAMALAVKARFRPLLATSLTSVMALIPLALSDPFWESLAYTLIFGLLSSTLLVIVSFPYYYLAAEYLRSKFSRRKGLSWFALLVIDILVLTKLRPKMLRVGLAVYLAIAVAFWLNNKIKNKALNGKKHNM
jgi:multidrug efflux pump subunit AcrB